MKIILIVYMLIISFQSNAQMPYPTLLIDKGTLPCDQIKLGKDTIKLSNRIIYYNYAVKLSDKKNSHIDSVNKAGQIFDRIYRIDTASEIGINALAYRTKIEMQLISKVKNALLGTWGEIECTDPWGENAKTVGRKLNSQIAFSLNKIKLLSKSEKKEVLYEMRYYFNWEFPSITVFLAVENSDKNWA